METGKSAKDRIRELTESVTGLPTLPKVVTQITQLPQNPRTSAEEVGRAITMDQSLASKVLKLVNSAFYGFPGRINTITHAIVILGFNTVKNIVLTASIFEKLGGRGGSQSFDLEKFWLHSIGTGVVGREIARKINFRFQEEVFISGLLHDIGKVIAFKYLPEEFAQVCQYRDEKNCLLMEAEKKVMDVTHDEVGGWLGTKWNLPEDLRFSILYHHFPKQGAKHETMVSVIHLADIFTRALGVGSGGDNRIPIVDTGVWDKLRFSRPLLDKIYKDIDAELEKASIFFQIM